MRKKFQEPPEPGAIGPSPGDETERMVTIFLDYIRQKATAPTLDAEDNGVLAEVNSVPPAVREAFRVLMLLLQEHANTPAPGGRTASQLIPLRKNSPRWKHACAACHGEWLSRDAWPEKCSLCQSRLWHGLSLLERRRALRPPSSE
jgi:hypothetical protein